MRNESQQSSSGKRIAPKPRMKKPSTIEISFQLPVSVSRDKSSTNAINANMPANMETFDHEFRWSLHSLGRDLLMNPANAHKPRAMKSLHSRIHTHTHTHTHTRIGDEVGSKHNVTSVKAIHSVCDGDEIMDTHTCRLI